MRMADGGRVYLRDAGSGPPVLFVHGWGTDGDFAHPQVTGLCDRFRLIAPDLRGHGGSDPLPEGAGLELLADDLAEIITRLDLAGPVLWGWSLGALLCWLLLDRHPQIVPAHLIIEDMSPKMTSDGSWQGGLKDDLTIARADLTAETLMADWDGFCPIFVPRIFAGQPDDPATARLIDNSIKAAQRTHRPSAQALWRALARADARDAVRRIAVPTTVVRGAHSRLYGPRTAQWIAEQAPDARVETFVRSGHAPHLEQPEDFNQLLASIVDAAHPQQQQQSNLMGGSL